MTTFLDEVELRRLNQSAYFVNILPPFAFKVVGIANNYLVRKPSIYQALRGTVDPRSFMVQSQL